MRMSIGKKEQHFAILRIFNKNICTYHKKTLPLQRKNIESF